MLGARRLGHQPRSTGVGSCFLSAWPVSMCAHMCRLPNVAATAHLLLRHLHRPSSKRRRRACGPLASVGPGSVLHESPLDTRALQPHGWAPSPVGGVSHAARGGAMIARAGPRARLHLQQNPTHTPNTPNSAQRTALACRLSLVNRRFGAGEDPPNRPEHADVAMGLPSRSRPKTVGVLSAGELASDLQLRGPPIGKGAFAAVYAGTFRGSACAVRHAPLFSKGGCGTCTCACVHPLLSPSEALHTPEPPPPCARQVKVLHPEHALPGSTQQRLLLREGQFLMRCSHKCVGGEGRVCLRLCVPCGRGQGAVGECTGGSAVPVVRCPGPARAAPAGVAGPKGCNTRWQVGCCAHMRGRVRLPPLLAGTSCGAWRFARFLPTSPALQQPTRTARGRS